MEIEVGAEWLVVDRKDGSNYFAEDDGSLSGMLMAIGKKAEGDADVWIDEDTIYVKV